MLEDNPAYHELKIYSIIFRNVKKLFQYSLCSGIKSPTSKGRNRPKHHACEAIGKRELSIYIAIHVPIYIIKVTYTIVLQRYFLM